MHAHLLVYAGISEGTSAADVTTLDDPDLTGRRPDIRCQLIGNQTKRVT